jgi:tRNA(Arg) A34 adenosine deaminase TadA
LFARNHFEPEESVTMTDSKFVSAPDEDHLRHAIALAARARENGNHPFGSIVVAADGRVVEGMNTVVTETDPTGHAETNVVRLAAGILSIDELHASTLYTSTEPCAMCAGAIHWAGIPRVVYALGEDDLRAMVPAQGGEPTLTLPCRDVFAAGGGRVDVAGPALHDEAVAVHAGFWG